MIAVLWVVGLLLVVGVPILGAVRLYRTFLRGLTEVEDVYRNTRD